jgi:ribosomal protein S18 acetylase RimI-like enzyme
VAKAKTFAEGEDHYYIFFLGTHSSARGRGLCSKIIKYYQSIAQQKGKPIWIEAATQYCAKLYERHGFVITQTIILGKGMADKNREFKEGGEGFKILGMVWRPTARQEEVKGQK